MKINILYEDEYILALDKPSGLLMHLVKSADADHGASADSRKREPVLTDWILENYPDLKEVGESQILQNGEVIKRPGIVHRLDRETSGVIIVAKTKEAHQFLKEQFQNRKVEKIYNAVVWGNFLPEKMEGVINKPIGRSASDFRKWSAEHGAKGELREAVTEYKVLAQGKFLAPRNSVQQNEVGAYLEIRPKTGRTHQIRVHLKAIGHPVVGDKLYGPTSPKASRGKEKNLGFDRLALHALSIKLELPNHTHITIESALPKEFKNVKNILK
ncbi:MAG: RluA family pseudouridine synthase [Patescibacteria group bacterium]